MEGEGTAGSIMADTAGEPSYAYLLADTGELGALARDFYRLVHE